MKNEKRRKFTRICTKEEFKLLPGPGHLIPSSLFSFFFVLFSFILFSFACKTIPIEEPVAEPEPEPAPVHRSIVIFNTTSNPSTGYDWEIWIDYDSTGRFALNNFQQEEIYPGVVGSPLKQTYTLRSSQPGRVYVHFIYKRSREAVSRTGGLGRYIYTFDIDSNLKINLFDEKRTVNRGYTEDSLPIIEDPDIQN